MKAWMDWMGEMTEAGYYVSGAPFDDGHVLSGTETAGSDGSYGEGDDVVGGYIIVTADDLDQAIERSKACPIFAEGGSVEIRGCREM